MVKVMVLICLFVPFFGSTIYAKEEVKIIFYTTFKHNVPVVLIKSLRLVSKHNLNDPINFGDIRNDSFKVKITNDKKIKLTAEADVKYGDDPTQSFGIGETAYYEAEFTLDKLKELGVSEIGIPRVGLYQRYLADASRPDLQHSNYINKLISGEFKISDDLDLEPNSAVVKVARIEVVLTQFSTRINIYDFQNSKPRLSFNSMKDYFAYIAKQIPKSELRRWQLDEPVVTLSCQTVI